MKQKFQSLQPTARKNVVCAVVILAISAFLGAYAWWNNRPAAAISYSTTLSEEAALESHVFIAGDIYWGRRMNDHAQQSSLKEAHPFSQLHKFQPELYDAWVGNLECPAVPGVNQPVGYETQLWEFNCPVEYMPEAAKWFDVFSLANNHTSNQGREEGLEATRKQLEEHDIQHFGHFNPHIKDDVCEVVSLPARASIDDEQKDVHLPVAMCGFHGVYYTITDSSMAVMQEYAKHMPVMAFPHMGQEYQAVSDQVREELYRKMIDNGADVVLGGHPHWVQPTEVYKGKLIVYSQGNFIFDQQFSADVMRGLAMSVVMSVQKSDASEEAIKQWTALGEECHAFQSGCLGKAKEQDLKRLPINWYYRPISVDMSEMVTRPGDLIMQADTLKRLNWKETETGLGQVKN